MTNAQKLLLQTDNVVNASEITVAATGQGVTLVMRHPERGEIFVTLTPHDAVHMAHVLEKAAFDATAFDATVFDEAVDEAKAVKAAGRVC